MASDKCSVCSYQNTPNCKPTKTGCVLVPIDQRVSDEAVREAIAQLREHDNAMTKTDMPWVADGGMFGPDSGAPILRARVGSLFFDNPWVHRGGQMKRDAEGIVWLRNNAGRIADILAALSQAPAEAPLDAEEQNAADIIESVLNEFVHPVAYGRYSEAWDAVSDLRAIIEAKTTEAERLASEVERYKAALDAADALAEAADPFCGVYDERAIHRFAECFSCDGGQVRRCVALAEYRRQALSTEEQS